MIEKFLKISFASLCLACAFVSQSAGAESRRLSSFSVPRQQVFFNSPSRFNNFNQFNSFNNNAFRSNSNFNRFNAFGGIGSNRFDGINNLSFNNNANLVDARQAKEINNFSKIRQLGNALIEVDQFGIGQRIFIDGQGNLIGGAKPPEARTVQQLKEFYLANREKFQGNAKATVDRFLARQGGLSNGLFKIDLDDFGLDFNRSDVKELLAKRFNGDKAAMRREMGLAALNYLLNSLQGRFKIKIPKESIRPDGTVNLNLAPFFRGEVLAIFNQADDTSPCTGKIRLNRLINFTMNPDNYYKILNVPTDIKDLSNAFGVQSDKTLTFGNKIVVGLNEKGGKDSVPANGSQRILEVQTAANVPGSSCYRSLDTEDQPPGGEQAKARSIKTEGILFKQDAEEWLCLAGNGFMQGYLFDGNGKRIAAAPAKIATSTNLLKPEIKAVISCLDCHRDGFIGGGKRPDGNEFYTERSGDVKNGPTVFRDNFGRFLNHRDFFIKNPQYKERAVRDSDIFRRARQETGSEFLDANGKPFPTLPMIEQGFQNVVTAENAATELGLGDSPQAVAKAKALLGRDFEDRTAFEAKYCNLIRGQNDFLNENQEQGLLRNEQLQNNRFFPTHNNR